nr:hypothetical protein [uncultured Pedobacter sp.]
MKQIISCLALLILSFTQIQAQENPIENNKFKGFTRAEVSYLFGIKDAFNRQNINSLHIKLVAGTANQYTGFGVGFENASYKQAGGSGLSFQTINFSGNVHLLAKPISTDEVNFFLKAAAGYAPRIFRTYNKGANYEFGPGILFTTKRKAKYFLQAMYQFQDIENFYSSNGRLKIKGIGLGVGTWF